MAISLDDKATQTEFAKLVGVTQPSISKRIDDGTLKRGGTYREWMSEYCAHIRSVAAGRGGDAQSQLTAARTAESHEKTLAMQYDRLLREEVLINVADIEPAMSELVSNVRDLTMAAADKLLERIRSQHKIELDDEECLQPFRDALASAAKAARELHKAD